ncbi:hypothetical protein CL659_00795 [bacterium]|nr:hypothetical protein [bacterium]|tara:strand:- start:12438 stop:14183 length:1746 start_codon:yes stop_codon:yes gene_type:complete
MNSSSKKSDNRLKIFINLLKPHWKSLSLGIFILLVLDVIQVLLPLVTKEVIDRIEQGNWDNETTIQVFWVFLIAGIATLVLRYSWRVLIFGASRKVERDLRKKLYERLTGVPMKFYDKVQIGDLMGRASNDIEAVRNMSGILVICAFDGIVWGVLTIGFMFSLDWHLTLAVLVPFPLIVIFTRYMGQAFHKQFKLVQEAFSKLSAHVEQAAGGILALKGFRQEFGEARLLTSKANDVKNEGFKLANLDAWFEPVFRVAAGIGITVLIIYGGGRVISGYLTVGDLAAFLQYFNYLVWPFMALGFMVNLYQRGTASLMRIQEMIDEPQELRPEGFKPQVIDIEFKNMSFLYSEENNVLKQISFKLKEGEKLAIVGPTGCGKSTIFKLITALYSAKEKTILINNQDIENINKDSWRSMIAWSPQDPVTFSETIRYNLDLGKNIDDDRLWESLKIAALDSDVEKMSGKLDSKVGERGISLSGGQRQRLALARAICQDRKLILLDDALSAVDAETESKILINLIDVIKDKTVIVSTHRISSIFSFDKVLLLSKDGSMEACDKPDRLLKENRKFAQMWKLSQGESVK